jgi:hypothetical protein
MEHGQLVTKGENLSLQDGAGPKSGSEKAKRPKTELIADATVISRMMVTSAFSNRSEFSVCTVMHGVMLPRWSTFPPGFSRSLSGVISISAEEPEVAAGVGPTQGQP